MHTQQLTGSAGRQIPQVALREQDMFTVILNLLKNTAREYATAVTEANCPNVRQTMQNMLNETLSEQADCYQVMNRQGWYPPASAANRHDIQQSVQKHRQAATELMQIAGQGGFYGEMGRYQPMHQPRQSYQPHQSQQSFQSQQSYQPPQSQQSWTAEGQSLQAEQWQQSAPQHQHQPLQGQNWNAEPGSGWETGGHAGQAPAYDSQAWRYGARQHGGEITQ